jgi:hypothetical protein
LVAAARLALLCCLDVALLHLDVWHPHPLCILGCLLAAPAKYDLHITLCSYICKSCVLMLSCSPQKQDKDPEHEESDFDKETARLAVRMLTARAAGIVLQNVAQVDDFKAAWLQEHFKQVGQRSS